MPRKTTTTTQTKKRSTTSTNTIKKGVAKTTHPAVITKIIVHCDVGYKNSLFIRGQGGTLSWDKGIELKNLGPDQWVWETRSKSADCEFKLLFNDKLYEEGENHQVSCGSSCEIAPHFIWPS